MSTTTLTASTGSTLILDEDQMSGLVNLLAETCPGSIEELCGGHLGAQSAVAAGESLAGVSVEVVEYVDSSVLIPAGAGPVTDPALAFAARLAEALGAGELAERARGALLKQAAAATIREPNDAEHAMIRQWAEFLVGSNGVLLD
jgi:hypothetical protein